MKSRLEDGHSVVLQHMEEGCLSGIVKTKEEELCVLVEETQRGKSVPEPI